MSELQMVPSVRELVKTHPEYVVARAWDKDGNPTWFHITDAGHAYLGEIMAANARVRIANGEGDWVQPPSRTDLAASQIAT